MKTLHLNLAARPYRDYRPVWLVAAVLAVASTVFVVSNVQTAYRYFVNTERTRTEIDRLERESAQEAQRAREVQTLIRGFDRKSLNIQTRFINAQIAERAFSWSELLDQLERVIPRDVRLTSLNPSVTADGRTHLIIRCVAKTANGLVETIKRMQSDPHFERLFPDAEDTLEGGLHQFTINTDYRAEPLGVIR